MLGYVKKNDTAKIYLLKSKICFLIYILKLFYLRCLFLIAQNVFLHYKIKFMSLECNQNISLHPH